MDDSGEIKPYGTEDNRRISFGRMPRFIYAWLTEKNRTKEMDQLMCTNQDEFVLNQEDNTFSHDGLGMGKEHLLLLG
ncbi:hypothetical protein J32TS6_12880 [Virgibacillus pantothenticus]|uniref:Uncharacterized protein n=1 Tax=Virgibacillus pantothenticus TaxID=1473 RepID=A0A0L0QLK5_VIRPA|nr:MULTISPECIES: hypothetical protein [Virgibacillus]API93149.1 hypothetical protein BKP57_15850 [Virgibacillus sp. 6R]KNE19441.1 hypothetical protein AFK71_13185 [Virgibacillus pantothenticus]MBS7428808.1 hypothetical protein [Virgibacillus sp. 19R1-5]MBU8568556.1 hypothetical protein [Virgibacillus pantothenticus]MBU8602473.1 hypothetical protein [Virgibacillus pantothenticus]